MNTWELDFDKTFFHSGFFVPTFCISSDFVGEGCNVARCNALHNLGQHWETLSQVGAASTSNNLLTRGSKAKGCFLRIGHLDNPSMTDRSKEENWSFASLHLINWDPISRLYKLPITYMKACWIDSFTKDYESYCVLGGQVKLNQCRFRKLKISFWSFPQCAFLFHSQSNATVQHSLIIELLPCLNVLLLQKPVILVLV